jgi:hypothetical protein
MMAIGRNPDEPPKVDSAKDEEARAAGLKRIQIIIDTPEGEPDDPNTPPITFYAYADTVPRQGEILLLQDGKQAKVQDVYRRIGNAGKTRFTTLVPIVYATLNRHAPGGEP